MPNTHTTLAGLFTDIANAIRAKTGDSESLIADCFPNAIAAIETGGQLEPLSNPATADKILQGYEAYDDDGEVIEGIVNYESNGFLLRAYGLSQSVSNNDLSTFESTSAATVENEVS